MYFKIRKEKKKKKTNPKLSRPTRAQYTGSRSFSLTLARPCPVAPSHRQASFSLLSPVLSPPPQRPAPSSALSRAPSCNPTPEFQKPIPRRPGADVHPRSQHPSEDRPRDASCAWNSTPEQRPGREPPPLRTAHRTQARRRHPPARTRAEQRLSRRPRAANGTCVTLLPGN
jgi:hypothetical protein